MPSRKVPDRPVVQSWRCMRFNASDSLNSRGRPPRFPDFVRTRINPPLWVLCIAVQNIVWFGECRSSSQRGRGTLSGIERQDNDIAVPSFILLGAPSQVYHEMGLRSWSHRQGGSSDYLRMSSRPRIARANRTRYSSARRRSSGICRRANTYARLAGESEDRGIFRQRRSLARDT
jgi:hypothetical protein